MSDLIVAETFDGPMKRGDKSFAGMHITVDLYGAKNLDNIKHVQSVMEKCVTICGATLLHLHLHHFTPNNGVTGVAVLAESHISVHTWPEREFAAFDIFMCGTSKPELAIDILKAGFKPTSEHINIIFRGEKLKE